MLKKIALFICLTLVSVSNMLATGAWTVYPLYNGEYSSMIETPDLVYYVSNSSLFAYNKTTDETRAYNSNNKLSDNIISRVAYNPKHKFLLIMYENCNMDVLYDNGRLVNLPEIYQTNLNTEKVINSMDTADDYITIASNFGYVVYDAVKMVVKESRIWNKNIRVATVAAGYIFIQCDGTAYYAPLDSKHVTFEDFIAFRPGLGASLMYAMGSSFVYYNASIQSYNRIHTFRFDSSQPFMMDALYKVGANPEPFQPFKDGFYTVAGNKIVVCDQEGKLQNEVTLPAELVGSKVAFWDSPQSIWVANSDGTAQFDISTGSARQLTEYYKPEGMSCQRVAYITKSNDGKRVYFTNQSCIDFRTCGSDDINGYNNRQTTDIITGGKIYNVNVPDTDFPAGYGRHGEDMVLEDPLNPDRYYLVSRHYGLYAIENGHLLGIMDNTNSAVETGWIMNCYQFAFDQYNNLLLTNLDGSESSLVIVPYETLQKFGTMTKSDSRKIVYDKQLQYENKKENRFGICHKTGIIAMSSSVQSGPMLFIDTQGKKNWDMSKVQKMSAFTDQDGNTVAPLFITYLVEDQLGRLWIGTDDGILEVTDPSTVFESGFRVNRLKVPRNDGTNYADYLLAGEQINWISVDPSNRKWIATQNSGVYLVSANGDKILEHFTVDNSPLPTNTVNAIEASSIDNMVYMGTNYGALAYSSDATPAADNYDDVLVYPNPVRPDYTGWVNITGLMENSLVKIADASGNVLFQGRSEGGMISWDGCNLSGERARSGVYFVLASSSGDSSNFATVAKLMIIK